MHINLPVHLRYKIENIQVAMMFNSSLIKESDLNSVYKKFVEDLKILETSGVYCKVLKEKICGSVVSYPCDNLGAHGIGGFLENFSTNHFPCRYCYFELSQLRNSDVSIKALRDKENYIQDVANNSRGVKKNSPFNDLIHFHVTNPGMPPCLGHDLFRGVFETDIQEILNVYVSNNCFTWPAFIARCNKIQKKFKGTIFPAISNGKSIGSMHQNWCLIAVLPIILKDFKKVVKKGELWELILVIVEITRIVTSHKLFKSQVDLLRYRIATYFNLRGKCLTSRMVPKSHYLMHYPEMFEKFGPLINQWTLHFEHKHGTFKHIMNRAKNFKNPCKLMLERHQYQQTILFGQRSSMKLISNTSFENEEILKEIPELTEYKILAKSVYFNGILFKSDDFVIRSVDSEDFSIEVVRPSFFALKPDYSSCQIIGDAVRMNYIEDAGYYQAKNELELNQNSNFHFDIEELIFHKPINIWIEPQFIYCSPMSYFAIGKFQMKIDVYL